MRLKKQISPRFIFLELLDEEVNDILNNLRNIFCGKREKSNIHITVRGPYYGQIRSSDIDRYQSILKNHSPLLIGGTGIFKNSKEYIVYVKVVNDGLKKIWWKPDYPPRIFGFNPHVTIYKGPDKEFANSIYTFLKKEKLTLLCHDFHLTTFISNRSSLFPDEDLELELDDESPCLFSEYDEIKRKTDLIDMPFRGKVRADLLERAKSIK